MSIRRHYVDTSIGQIHVRDMPAIGQETLPTLLCLHPAPSSGHYFSTAIPLMAESRRVIAPDYPGYGGSDPVETEPTIELYAEVMNEIVAQLCTEPVDILGFHTGCLVGAELAIEYPGSVRRLLLCDVPYFDTETRNSLKSKIAVPMPITAELDSLKGAWTFNIASRIEDVPLPRAFELFAEHLRAGTNDYLAFAAAFSYSAEQRLPIVQSETIVLATQSGLHAPSIAAAELIPSASLVDVTEVSSAVFEAGAQSICRRIDEASR